MNKNFQAQLVKGIAEMAILSILRKGACYGLEILSTLNNDAGLPVADGTIYPILHRLEKAGLVSSEWQTNTENGRPRKYYSLTDDGFTRQQELVASWHSVKKSLKNIL